MILETNSKIPNLSKRAENQLKNGQSEAQAGRESIRSHKAVFKRKTNSNLDIKMRLEWTLENRLLILTVCFDYQV